MIRIMASVSGGFPGSRQSRLKSNDEIREFESLTEAQQVASELNEPMKGPAGVTIPYEVLESEELSAPATLPRR